MSRRNNTQPTVDAATDEPIGIRPLLLACCASAALLCAAGPAWAQQAAPAPVSPYTQPFDDEWAVGKHSPSGLNVRIPPTLPTSHTTATGWEYTGHFDVGFTGGDTENRAALFRQYRDLSNGLNLASFGLRAHEPGKARYLELNASQLGRRDQSYALRTGRYNGWQVTASFVGTPHVFTDGYHSLWDGVGSGDLTLRSPLTPGGTGVNATDNANVAAVANGPESTLRLTREKSSVRFDGNLSPRWKTYFSYSQEARNGARPFGAVWGAGGGTAPMEIAEPIDYKTHDLQFGLSYADDLNALNLKASASFFRNGIDTLTYQGPYRIPPAAGSTLPAGRLFTQGRLDLTPDNDAFNLSAEYSRELPRFFDGRLTAVLAVGTARQDDNLLPYTTVPGLTLANVVGSNWDTTAALSRTSAEGRSDTVLGDVTLQISPVDGLSLTGKAHYFDNANKSTPYSVCNPGATYVDSNPLLAGNQAGGLTADGCTGVWGRLLNDGTGINVLLGANTTPAGNFPIQNTPFSNKQYSFGFTADYRLRYGASVNAGVEHEVIERTYRERKETTEDRLSLGYVDHDVFGANLRISYQYAQRRGSAYLPNPNKSAYSGRLTGIPTTAGTNVVSWAVYNNAGVRMYDLSDRNQHTFNLRLNKPLGDTLDASLSALVKKADHPDAQYGRGELDQRSINLDINYQPSASRIIYASVGYQNSRSNQASIANTGTCNIGQVTALGTITALNAEAICAAPGGPIYPLNFGWFTNNRDSNYLVSFGANQKVGKMRLNLDYTRTFGRSALNYDYVPGGAIAVATVPLAGNGWPNLETGQDAFDLSLTRPIGNRAAIELGYRFETGDIEDWRYRGLNTTHVVTAAAANLPAVVVLDTGPRDYRVHMATLTVHWTF